jgi:hypothetical protein
MLLWPIHFCKCKTDPPRGGGVNLSLRDRVCVETEMNLQEFTCFDTALGMEVLFNVAPQL